jgi:BRCA1-associated protein
LKLSRSASTALLPSPPISPPCAPPAHLVSLSRCWHMPEHSHYSVVIELYDHTSPQPSSSDFSPLHRSSTKLPPTLDADLRASRHRLVLPQIGKSFWDTPLAVSRKLDTRLPAPIRPAGSSSLTSPREEHSAPPRIWSQHFGLPSPPTVATDKLWTPSKASPSSSSSNPSPSKQQPVLDYRFGPIEIDSISYPTPRMPSAVGGLVSPRVANRSLPSTQEEERPAETSGTSELFWGTIHLYREAGAEESSLEEKKKARDEDDGKSVGLVSVPGVLNAAALLAFIAPALESVEQVRMLRYVLVFVLLFRFPSLLLPLLRL